MMVTFGLTALVTWGIAWPRPVPLPLESAQHRSVVSVLVGPGDVDGDGTADLVLGAPDSPVGGQDVGWFGLWRGGAKPRSIWERTGRPGERLGSHLAALGDVDGDGLADVAAALPEVGGGRVEVYHGGPNGLGLAPRWVNAGPEGSRYGADLDGLGDVDGDRFADLAVVSFPGGVGRVTVHRGSAAGLEAKVYAEVAGDEVGWAGDLDGDGRAELVVSDPTSVRVYRLRPPPASSGVATPELLADLDGGSFVGVGDVDGDGKMDLALVRDGLLFIVRGGPTLTELATDISAIRVTAAGDMNGDGYADLVVSREEHTAAFVIGGVLSAPHRVREVSAFAHGGSIATAAPLGIGDLDGDGFGDVAIGRSGGVEVIRGVATGLGQAPIRLVTPHRGPAGSMPLRRADAFAFDAADLDSDGFSDLVVGSTWANGGAGRVDIHWGGPNLEREASVTFAGEVGDGLGAAVVAGGDFDGDGYEDAWVGAPTARNGSFTNAGYLAFVRGGARATTLERRVSGGFFEFLGGMIGDLGDLDLDGRVELAFIGRGSTPTLGLLFGDGRASQFLALGAGGDTLHLRQRPIIGDFDGDGRDELVNGFRSRTVGSLGASGFEWREMQPASLDAICANAGDVDGDGDVEMVEVAMHVYCATDNLPQAKLGLVAGGPDFRFGPRIQLYDEETCAGWSVDSAGDVDGDGFADLIVGAPQFDEGGRESIGQVYVHHGAKTGLRTVPSWTLVGDRAQRHLGSAVAGAGDLDGDGFSDVVVAGALVEASEPDDVLVQVYRGNGGLGTTSAWHYAVSARQLDVPTPLPPGGRSTSPTAFAVRATAASPFGRRVALEVEAKPHGVPFDGRGLHRSDFDVSGQSLTVVVDGLEVDTAYSFRARLLTHPAQAPRQATSHWIYGGRPGEARGVHVRTRANRPPTASPFTATLADQKPYLTLPPGLLKGASDPDNDPLVALPGRPPAHGVAEIREDGVLLYEPDRDFVGVERFSFIVSDGLGGEVEMPITLIVPGPDGCGVVLSDERCMRGDVFLVVRLDDGGLASVHCVVDAAGEPVCDLDANGELRLSAPVCGF